MATYYIDEDLTTGLNDGSSKENAFQTFAGAMSGIGTLTEDGIINFYSLGVVSTLRALEIGFGGFNLTFNFMDGAVAYNSSGYQPALRMFSDNTSKLTVMNPRLKIGANGYGIQAYGATDVDIYNMQFIGTSAKRGVYNSNTSATVKVDGMIATGCENAIGNTSTGTVNAFNCYGNGSVAAYSNGSTGTLNLTTCASNDATGSVGLQNIAYDTSTFTNVTSGSEDFTLVDGSPLIGVGTITSSLTDINGSTWGTPRDIGTIAYTTASETITFSYTEMNNGFSGYFNFVDDPTLRKFGKNASWFGIVKGVSASLKCGSTFSTPYTIFVDGVKSNPTLTGGEIELFSGLTDGEHHVNIVVNSSYAITNNELDTTELAILSVTGTSPYITNIPLEYVSNPSYLGLNSYSTKDIPDVKLTPTYKEVSPWDYEFGQVIFKSTCDEIWLYTDNTSVVYSVDGGALQETTFTESNSDAAGTIRRAVMLSDSLDGTTEHTYRLWGGTGEVFGIQGIVCLLNDTIVSQASPGTLQRVMTIGASVVEGSTGDYEGYADTWLVGKDLNYLMVKAALAGTPVTTLETHYPDVILANGVPDVVIFCSSTNDSGTQPEIQADYESMINTIIASGVSKVVCRGIVSYLQKQHDALRDAVLAIDLPNVNFVSTLTLPAYDSVDGLHPTATGFETIAAWEEPFFDTLITVTFNVTGVTYDNSQNILGGCQVSLFKHAGSGIYSFVATDTSDPTTGAYDFNTSTDESSTYMVVAHNVDIPNVFDVSDNNITPTELGSSTDLYLRSQANKTETTTSSGRVNRAKYNGGAM